MANIMCLASERRAGTRTLVSPRCNSLFTEWPLLYCDYHILCLGSIGSEAYWHCAGECVPTIAQRSSCLARVGGPGALDAHVYVSATS